MSIEPAVTEANNSTNQHANATPQKENSSTAAQDLDDKANSVVRTHSYTALGAGLIPIPLVDLVALAGIQLNMVRSIANIYDVPFKKDAGKSAIGALVGSVTPVSIAGPSASLVKVIPLIGSLAGVVTMSVFGGAATYAVGKVFIQHFAAGGTFLDFDPDSVKDYFAEKFAEGEKIAQEAKRSTDNAN